jgi:Cu(I)/Ag(I) efflux system protein CusF
MNRLATVVAMSILASSSFAQSGGMKGMEMKDMPMKKGEAKSAVHKATGVVTKVDQNKVTIKHEPVQSLNWPTMNMGFVVKDKALMEKLAKDKKIEFEFVQEGKDYVVTGVK